MQKSKRNFLFSCQTGFGSFHAAHRAVTPLTEIASNLFCVKSEKLCLQLYRLYILCILGWRGNLSDYTNVGARCAFSVGSFVFHFWWYRLAIPFLTCPSSFMLWVCMCTGVVWCKWPLFSINKTFTINTSISGSFLKRLLLAWYWLQ